MPSRLCPRGHIVPRGVRRCVPCSRDQQLRRDAMRPSPKDRGYGTPHQRARRELKKTLPGWCGYGCGTWLEPDGAWHAAHVVDGHPEEGYIAACVSCNQRAKRRPRRDTP